MKKHISAAALLLTLSMLITACSMPAGPGTSPAGASQTQATTEAPTEPTLPALPADDVKSELRRILALDDPAGEVAAAPEEVDDLVSVDSMRSGIDFEVEEVEAIELSDEERDSMDRAMRAYKPGVSNLIVNDAPAYYLYEQLSDLQKKIYDAIYMVAIDPTTTDNIVTLKLDGMPAEVSFSNNANTAQLALSYDHPELWWVNFWNGVYDVAYRFALDSSGRCVVYLNMTEPYTTFEADVTAFNDSVDSFLAGISRTDPADMALQVHDRLIEMAVYDDDTCNAHRADLAHTAFGALVANSAGVPHHCVCDGYSLAYTYLLQQLGITSTVVSGMAGSDGDYGGHAWSIVQLDGYWYETDSTWDDFTDLLDKYVAEHGKDNKMYKYYKEMANDKKFMNKLQHMMYMISSEKIQQYKAPSKLAYYTDDGRYILYPVGDSQRWRYCDYPGKETTTNASIARLLPKADGQLDDIISNKQVMTGMAGPFEGTYYMTGIDTVRDHYDEAALLSQLGQNYYTDYLWFELNYNGTGRVYSDGQVYEFEYYFASPDHMTITYDNGRSATFGFDGGEAFSFTNETNRYHFTVK